MNFVQQQVLLFLPEHLLCSSEGVCVDSETDNSQSFSIPSDYEPVVLDYFLEMPACFGKPARFVANSASGGGCEDDTNFYIYVAGTTVTVNPLDTP